jgi:transaldolase
MMRKIHELANLGQSIWIDYIRRDFITSGELQKLIDQGLGGVTSNPSIFEKAINDSEIYEADLKRLVQAGKSVQEISDSLVVEDIRLAADALRPVYDRTQGADGFVSLEVNPALARDTEHTLKEAKRLWSLVDRPNLMVKIPATQAGIPAISQALAQGVNINITLIFARSRYEQVMEAYLSGLEQRVDQGLPVDRISSVASFFVSRVDTKVDPLLEAIIQEGGPRAEVAATLLGQAGIANARLAYQDFKRVFGSDRFGRLKDRGARLQRPLWASTSTKNPAYPDILYVQELIGQHTVNTVPPQTLQAFLDHGEVRLTIEENLDEIREKMASLSGLEISLDQVTQELEDEGVAAFAKSHAELTEAIQEMRESRQLSR